MSTSEKVDFLLRLLRERFNQQDYELLCKLRDQERAELSTKRD